MLRTIWILGALALGLLAYAVFLPTEADFQPGSAADFWRAFYRQDPRLGRAVPTPRQGEYLVVRTPACCRSGRILSVPAAEVEGEVSAALRSFEQNPPDARFGNVAKWGPLLLSELEGKQPTAREVTDAVLRLRVRVATEETYEAIPADEFWPGIEGWRLQVNHLSWILSSQQLSEDLESRLEWRSWAIAGESLVWCLLSLLLLGSQLPGRVRPVWVGVRAGLWPLAVVGVWRLLRRENYSRGQFRDFYLTSIDRTHGWGDALLPALGLGLVLGLIAALFAWRWRAPRPRRLPLAILDATFLAIPLFAAAALAFQFSSVRRLVKSLTEGLLVPWELAFGGTLWLGATLVTFALRTRVPSPSESPAERSAPEGPPVTMGAHSSAEG